MCGGVDTMSTIKSKTGNVGPTNTVYRRLGCVTSEDLLLSSCELGQAAAGVPPLTVDDLVCDLPIILPLERSLPSKPLKETALSGNSAQAIAPVCLPEGRLIFY